ncbi:patatin family protein, partial [Yersinia pestis]
DKTSISLSRHIIQPQNIIQTPNVFQTKNINQLNNTYDYSGSKERFTAVFSTEPSVTLSDLTAPSEVQATAAQINEPLDPTSLTVVDTEQAEANSLPVDITLPPNLTKK